MLRASKKNSATAKKDDDADRAPLVRNTSLQNSSNSRPPSDGSLITIAMVATGAIFLILTAWIVANRKSSATVSVWKAFTGSSNPPDTCLTAMLPEAWKPLPDHAKDLKRNPWMRTDPWNREDAQLSDEAVAKGLNELTAYYENIGTQRIANMGPQAVTSLVDEVSSSVYVCLCLNVYSLFSLLLFLLLS